MPIGERGDASSYYGYGYGYPAYSYGYGTGYSYQAYGYGYGTPVTATIRAEQGSGLERSFRYAPFSSRLGQRNSTCSTTARGGACSFHSYH